MSRWWGNPLDQNDKDLQRINEIMDLSLSFLDRYLVDGLLTKEENVLKQKEGEFPYIALSASNFVKIILRVKKFCQILGCVFPTFIDVGCGIGTKLLLADLAGFDPFGVECTLAYVEKAKHLFRPMEYCQKHIYHQNALTFNYSGYHVVYFWRPMFDGNKQEALEREICETVDQKTIIIPLGNNIFELDKVQLYNIRKIQGSNSYNSIYIKMADEKEFVSFLEKIKNETQKA